MSIKATKAAIKLQQKSDSISPHQVIALLLEGALERINQAKSRTLRGEGAEAEILLRKIIGIVKGLRASLDLDRGGEVATNLDSLYEYIVARLENHRTLERFAVLDETCRLITEIKDGWDGIAEAGRIAALG